MENKNENLFQQINYYIYNNRKVELEEPLDLLCIYKYVNRDFQVKICGNKEHTKLYFIVEDVVLYIEPCIKEELDKLYEKSIQEHLKLPEDKINSVLIGYKQTIFNDSFMSDAYIEKFVHEQQKEAEEYSQLKNVCSFMYHIGDKGIRIKTKQKGSLYYFTMQDKKGRGRIVCRGEIPSIFLKTTNFNYQFYFQMFLGQVFGLEYEEVTLPENEQKIFNYFNNLYNNKKLGYKINKDKRKKLRNILE